MNDKFAIGAMMGAFEDEHEFPDPFGLSTVFTVRRAGSNALLKLTRERAKGDRLTTILAEAAGGVGQSLVASALDKASKAGIHAVDVLARLGEYKLDDALAKLVKWENEPNGVPYNAGNARELLDHDGWLDRAKVPEDAWKILEDDARETWEAFHDKEAPFKGLTEIQVGDAYVCFILHWSKEKEAFRTAAMEEAVKN